MAYNNYHFSVVAGEVGAIIAVDKKLSSGTIGYAFTRELNGDDIQEIERVDRMSIRRRLTYIHGWSDNSKVRQITQVIPISAGLNRHDHNEAYAIKNTLRKLQAAIAVLGPLAKDEPHLNKFHLVSGDYTTNLQTALGNGSLRALINGRFLSETKRELQSILGTHHTSHW